MHSPEKNTSTLATPRMTMTWLTLLLAALVLALPQISMAAATAADAVVTFSVGGLETAKGERRASAGCTAEKLKAAAARSAAAAEEESQRLALRGG